MKYKTSEKKYAIISYITLFGLIIALVMNNERKHSFTSFHIRQSLGIFLLFMFLGYPLGYFDHWMITGSLWIFVFILWIYGFIGALQGEMRAIPIIGDWFQKIFKNL